MNRKKLIVSMVLIAAFMVVDSYAIYTYGIGANFTVAEAVIAGILIAALMNIPPFFIASFGYAILLDNTSDERQRRTAKIISAIGSVYILLIVSAIVVMRVVQIRANLADPEYNNLLMDTVFTITPVLTTIFAIILGLRAVEPNIDRLREAYEASTREYNDARERHDALYKHLTGEFEAIGATVGLDNFMEGVRSGSEDISLYINAINQAAAPKLTDRIKLHLRKLRESLMEKAEEIKLYLDPYGPAPGIIAAHPLSTSFLDEAALLTEIDADFEKMLNRQISETLSKKFKNISPDGRRTYDE